MQKIVFITVLFFSVFSFSQDRITGDPITFTKYWIIKAGVNAVDDSRDWKPFDFLKDESSSAFSNPIALGIEFRFANANSISLFGSLNKWKADEGIIESNAGELLRYRKHIGAENILIFTDIKKKHSSHSIASDISIVETAKAAQLFLSDGLIITGKSTGVEADINELSQVQGNTNLPILIGSGITYENIANYFNLADAFIVGSHFKIDGNWANKVDERRVKNFMIKLMHLRNSLSS